MLLATFGGVVAHLAIKFPDTLILPTFGNNDQKFHDNPIPLEDEKFFFNYTFGLWFDELPGNANNLSKQQKDTIYETFIKGGYYKLDLDDKLTVLSLNTLYFDSERDKKGDQFDGLSKRAFEQLNWLKQ